MSPAVLRDQGVLGETMPLSRAPSMLQWIWRSRDSDEAGDLCGACYGGGCLGKVLVERNWTKGIGRKLETPLRLPTVCVNDVRENMITPEQLGMYPRICCLYRLDYSRRSRLCSIWLL